MGRLIVGRLSAGSVILGRVNVDTEDLVDCLRASKAWERHCTMSDPCDPTTTFEAKHMAICGSWARSPSAVEQSIICGGTWAAVTPPIAAQADGNMVGKAVGTTVEN